MKKLVSLFCTLVLLTVVLPSFSINTVNGAGYPYGISSAAEDQAAAEQLLASEWQSWKDTYVTSSGAGGFKRVQRDPATNFDTVSEGMGYGLILAVSFNEQQLFNDLFGYVKKYYNSNGLMGWRIDAGGNIVGTGGKDAATDADEDVALALVFAHKKWGSSGAVNYENEAKTLINNIFTHMVERGTYVLKPGDTWGGSNTTNPSYFSPAWYRVFAEFTGNQEWIKVADKCYDIVNNIKKYNNNTGFVPDWCTADGTPASGRGYDFYYDAIRYAWRTAIDYSWYGTPEAKENCDAITNSFKKAGVSQIKDGYTITGNTTGQWHTATFTSCAAAGAMTSDLSTAKEFYNECVKVKDSGDYHYFGNSLRMMVLLYITGNFQNMMSGTTPTSNPTPTPTPTSTSTNNFKYGDVDGSGQVDSTDLTILKRFVLRKLFTFPNDKGELAADVNADNSIDSTDVTLMKRYILRKINKFPAE